MEYAPSVLLAAITSPSSHTKKHNYFQLQKPEARTRTLKRVIIRIQPTMLRDYYCCCCKSSITDADDVVSDRDPVLLVSGIAGSILNSKKKKSGFETRVWVRILLANLEFKKKLWSMYNPETGYFLLFLGISEKFQSFF